MLQACLAALIILVQASAFAEQPQRDAQILQKLYELTQDVLSPNIVPVRGGSADKPLGLYIGSDKDVAFRSGYKDVDPQTQCEWAYDLYQFIAKNGGGYDNYLKYQQERATKAGNQFSASELIDQSLRSYAGGQDPDDPFDRAHVPYDKQAAFADDWWEKNSYAYKSAIFPPKSWWIHDAVLDANNLWTRYEMLYGAHSGADFVSWRDADLATLLEKK